MLYLEEKAPIQMEKHEVLFCLGSWQSRFINEILLITRSCEFFYVCTLICQVSYLETRGYMDMVSSFLCGLEKVSLFKTSAQGEKGLM